MLQSVISNKVSASELSRKFIKSALLVGFGASKPDAVCCEVRWVSEWPPGKTLERAGDVRQRTCCAKKKRNLLPIKSSFFLLKKKLGECVRVAQHSSRTYL